ncbi:uncharacterized protein EHS24_007482 [Apiotrichum porosum]|uniref:GDT1 family protein n=1 Tax=Apiotrichum porosum TaxID=105984 RepID=A0A427XUI8_9TREE|nr:uncharacterized protein EHS24_007482 [Apiotrichum porosum]RSH82502.1 hypothetical protein EHS24_007482 [Apiotrichum porosum]
MESYNKSQAPEDDTSAHAFLSSFLMIVVSEIGDKTFLIAAIMATRHARSTVFAGAFASLVLMSILSAALGRIILGLIPKVWTLWAAAGLFLVFGVKMLQEAFHMSPSHMADEMREAEEEIEEDESMHDPSNPLGTSVPLEAIEEGRAARGPLENSLASRSRAASPAPAHRGASPRRSPSISLRDGVGAFKHSDILSRAREGCRNGVQLMTNPVFAQAFILTFLGEWGDRSQIATIAMAGAHSIPVVAFGTILGHSLCTLMAVMGGRYLSTKISVKHISLLGACAFIVFGLLYAIEAYQTPYGIDVPEI